MSFNISPGGHDEDYLMFSGVIRTHLTPFPVRWFLEERVHHEESLLLQRITQNLSSGVSPPIQITLPSAHCFVFCLPSH
ncbi:unnamed protein product [Euphydryas editha]|uniref:Uncharacterized protein n=1 Tax=Euphydryas editha TaxID=104508 RepID=A0AAU9U7C5_EUPED|nr:unnamed protein product [Euphydryas editha]